MRRNLKLIIFDLDGTLIDTMGAFADLAGELIATRYGWPFERARKRYLETSGIPFFRQLEVLFPGDGRNDSTAERFEDRKIGAFMHERVPDRAVAAIRQLKAHDIHTAISSNNFHSLVNAFARMDDLPVDLALGYRPGFGKGAPHFHHMRDHFGVTAAEMLFIGDSLTDAALAIENDVRFVAKIGTFSEEDFVDAHDLSRSLMVYDIHEILDLLEVR